MYFLLVSFPPHSKHTCACAMCISLSFSAPFCITSVPLFVHPSLLPHFVSLFVHCTTSPPPPFTTPYIRAPWKLQCTLCICNWLHLLMYLWFCMWHSLCFDMVWENGFFCLKFLAFNFFYIFIYLLPFVSLIVLLKTHASKYLQTHMRAAHCAVHLNTKIKAELFELLFCCCCCWCVSKSS